MKNNRILALSGNDIFSGGGLSADLATYTIYRLHGFVALTCLTAVTENGFEVIPTQEEVFQQQLDSLADVAFAGIKLGLLPNVEIAEKALEFVRKRPETTLVLDPVLVCKETHDLAVSALCEELIRFFPYASIVTPNLPEAELLSGMKIDSLEDMKQAAQKLFQLGAKAVIIKGGNRLSQEKAIDVFYDGSDFTIFENPVLVGQNAGAGCTFASSIMSRLVLGDSLLQAVETSKAFVCRAISHADQYGVRQYETNENN